MAEQEGRSSKPCQALPMSSISSSIQETCRHLQLQLTLTWPPSLPLTCCLPLSHQDLHSSSWTSQGGGSQGAAINKGDGLIMKGREETSALLSSLSAYKPSPMTEVCCQRATRAQKEEQLYFPTCLISKTPCPAEPEHKSHSSS